MMRFIIFYGRQKLWKPRIWTVQLEQFDHLRRLPNAWSEWPVGVGTPAAYSPRFRHQFSNGPSCSLSRHPQVSSSPRPIRLTDAEGTREQLLLRSTPQHVKMTCLVTSALSGPRTQPSLTVTPCSATGFPCCVLSLAGTWLFSAIFNRLKSGGDGHFIQWMDMCVWEVGGFYPQGISLTWSRHWHSRNRDRLSGRFSSVA